MNRVRDVRVVMGLNQRELSELSHTPQSLVCSIERGVLKPWPKVAERLSQALGIPTEKLFPEDEDILSSLARKD